MKTMTISCLSSRRKLNVNRLGSSFAFLLGLICGLLAPNAFSEQQSKSYSEAKIKAALVYKLMHFVELPNKKPLYLCVYKPNEDDVSAFQLLPPLTESGDALKVELLHEDAKLLNSNNCQVIFFSARADDEAKAFLSEVASDSLLTIGETSQFIKQGGMINLVRKGATIQFEINLYSLKQAGLKISSQVLRIADQIYTEDDR